MKLRPIQNLLGLSALTTAILLTGCGGGGGGSDGSDAGSSDSATQYAFSSKFLDGESAVSYTGQTARQILVADLTEAIGDLEKEAGAEVVTDIGFYISGDVDTTNYLFEITDETVEPGPTYGDISTGKTLDGKIAGGDGSGGGETSMLIGDEFFGWVEGMDGDPLPIELVDYLLAELQTTVRDVTDPTIDVTGGDAIITSATVDTKGRDFKQLIQKFLLGAVNFSQGTNDYLQYDFSGANTQDGTKAYTTAEHKWDESFGYFGAARNYNDYTDTEIRAQSGRAEYANGYNDLSGDGLIDLRSEINLSNSVNCAKRDIGRTTDFTKTAFDAFLAGRQALNEAAGNTLTADQITALDATLETQAGIAAKTWEKCISATVVHYINDLRSDLSNYEGDNFADLDNYMDVAKHWSEMKGFALGLQFSPYSPFRDGSVAGIDVDDLKQIFELMGDAPVLADGSQNGVAATGDAATAVAEYRADLLTAQGILQTAYEFDATDVDNW
ncbi:hypothetical protein A9Q99_13155 [Gammaproteobacteria bacterium 45_16_T64]|nr:hypothetical protein A9Q99_13155 [Gammaproteobacteria bacterium 45_16_T64]